MTCIAEIQSYVQEYAETIAEVLEVDVTIVDEECIRIGGTGPYKQNIGEVVPNGSFFKKILETVKPGFIYDRQQNDICKNCPSADTCSELATMGFPIIKNGKPVGVIGIMAFTLEQKRKIVDTSSKLLSFLKHMSSLLESKLLLIESNQLLQHQVQEAMQFINKSHSFGTMIGRSEAFMNLVNKARQIAPSLSTVLIRGESGTGKELLARAIHGESGRKQKPFIVVNCPSIPESLLESELFGYEGGSFTGASKEGKIGKFELAQHGTIFLDEIGDMPLSLQPKLLRAIQEKAIDRIGGKKPVPVDLRIIAATNKNLEEMVKDGAFREDLYYRLNVIPLFIPPLRERRDDIVLYIEIFLIKYKQLLNKMKLQIDSTLTEWLKNYHWPGNVRQLENVIEYMVNMAKTEIIHRQDLPYNLVESNGIYVNDVGLEEQLAKYEMHILKNYLSKGSSMQEKIIVAKELKISLAKLYRKLKKYHLN